jgi:hypothetical protein
VFANQVTYLYNVYTLVHSQRNVPSDFRLRIDVVSTSKISARHRKEFTPPQLQAELLSHEPLRYQIPAAAKKFSPGDNSTLNQFLIAETSTPKNAPAPIPSISFIDCGNFLRAVDRLEA